MDKHECNPPAEAVGRVKHPTIDKLRSAAARTTRVNVDVALLCEAALEASAWVEVLTAEVDRLNASRDLVRDRLDWLMCKIPRHVSLALYGVDGETGTMAEWLEKLDAAAGINKRAISRPSVRAY
jgi:hypothetical protein